MIKCLVIDDEPQAVALIADYVRKSDDLELIGTYTNPIDAFYYLNKHSVDLLFLDIQMPELSGMQLHKIIDNKAQVIFTTAYEQYAVDSYSLDVIDYLLKPISFERFLLSVEKYKKRIGNEGSSLQQNAKGVDYIFVKSGYRTQKVNYIDILYLESLDDYVAIHTKSDKLLTLETMRHFESTLPSDQFIRVHRSYMVSISKINFIENNRIVIHEKHIPVSRTYQEKFRKAIGRK